MNTIVDSEGVPKVVQRVKPEGFDIYSVTLFNGETLEISGDHLPELPKRNYRWYEGKRINKSWTPEERLDAAVEQIEVFIEGILDDLLANLRTN